MDNKDKILSNAISVFAEKGLHGAKMEEIAAKSGCNKAMIYYYFSSKENLFSETLVWIVMGIFGEMLEMEQGIFESNEMTPPEKLRRFISIQIEVFGKQMEYSRLFNYALGHEPDRVSEAVETAFKRGGFMGPECIFNVFDEGVRDGWFKKFDYAHALINIIAMGLIHVIAKPISEVIIGRKVENELEFRKDREASIIDVIFNGILARPADSPKTV
ncbi:TetR/AcrR family transcriptional regulator [Myxococcota bacterium]|nr:TetR/AcrR family transcriptional regulator [Myxococcota bacterium]MBU1498558.1 TetR/AcrR family transcriptional regulator [Myxococcota bacterium]